MAKRKSKDQIKHEKHEQVLDNYARVLQMVAIIAVVVVVISQQAFEKSEIPIWIPAGLLGVAVGLSPEQIGKIIADIIKTMIGKK